MAQARVRKGARLFFELGQASMPRLSKWAWKKGSRKHLLRSSPEIQLR